MASTKKKLSKKKVTRKETLTMNKIEKVTNDNKPLNKNLEVLKKHFSHCFSKSGNFDYEKFKQELSENEIDFYKESYGLDWLGKSYARILATDEATTLLKEDEQFNSKEENKNSGNLLIKGDNLEVLKHLSHAYYEKIKMIYIDPPYNTGGDGFVYQDDRKFTVDELQQLAGIDEEKAKRILDFTQSKSNSHSAWLTFMYPRLYIAKQLLKEDGVIFISIDDNEVAQLRILMDEVFGEENLVNIVVWKKRYNAAKENHLAIIHENILIYSKQKNNISDFLVTASKEYISQNFTEEDEYINERGPFYTQPLEAGKSMDDRPNLRFKIQAPDGTEIWPKRQWVWGKEKVDTALKEGRMKIYKGRDGSWSIRHKHYLYNEFGDQRRVKPFTIIDKIFSQEGTSEIEEYFGHGNVFPFPKPIKLLKHLIDIVDSSDSIYLDFFAGSGTTSDAVMQLNAEDGGKRKYILVQLPEKIDSKKDKIAYEFIKNELKVKEPTIFEITKERLIRASKKIKVQTINEKISEKEKHLKELNRQLDLDNNNEKIKQLETDIENLKNQDLGFKIFETMSIWEDYKIETDELNHQAKLFDETNLTEDDVKSLLVTWKTYDGQLLTESLKPIELSGYSGYYGKNKLYLMHKGFQTRNLKSLLEKIDSDSNFNPASIIAFGYHFESKNLREIAENIKSYTNKKKIDIDFITRY